MEDQSGRNNENVSSNGKEAIQGEIFTTEIPQQLVQKQSKQNVPRPPRTRTRKPRLFPEFPLEEAIRVPKVIKDFHGGNAWETGEVSKALNVKSSEDFFYLTASSRDYGLTIGTREAKLIELNTLGKVLVYATSKEEEKEALNKAFFNISLFKSVFEFYKGNALPELPYLKNTLETKFLIEPKDHEKFFQVYTQNLNFLEMMGVFPTGVQPTSQKKIDSDSRTTNLTEQKSKSQLTVFVAIPFVEKTEAYPKGFFSEVYTNLIKPAGEEAGFIVDTAKREGTDVIHSTIVNNLLNADLVIADLTEHNPNVLFELGLRMALEKPIALIRAKGTPAIFDVDNLLRVYDYDPNLWISTLKIDVPNLTSHINATWDGKDGDTYMQILIKRK